MQLATVTWFKVTWC